MKKYLIAAVLMGGGVAAQAAVSQSVAQIQARLAQPDVMCGRFDQAKQLVGIRKPLLSSGRFCVVKGSGVVWRTLKPFPGTLRLTRDQIVQFQGERVALRLDARNEPVVKMVNGVLFSMLAGDLGQLDTLFETSGTVAPQSWQVQLKARNPALARAIGTIRLEGNTHVQAIFMDEASGDRTAISFSEIRAGREAMTAEEAGLFE